VADPEGRRRVLESEIERRLEERFAALREEFERLRRESDGRWAGFVSRLDPRISGIVPAELLEPLEASPAPVRPPIEAARELDGASTQLEILRRLLDLVRRHASRAALLVLRGDAFSVWKAVGLPGGPETETVVRRVLLPAGTGALSRVANGTPCRLSSGNDVSARLSCGDARSAVLVPIAIGEKVSGALYADAAPPDADRFDADSVALLAFLAGLAIERVNARRLRPSPALAEFEYVFAAGEAVADDYDTQVASIWKEAPPAEDSSPASESREESASSPEPARHLSGPLSPKSEEEQRAEARRFARLLVSEIKLYNERAVEEGRAEGNVYRRLKQEIDLSRQVYEQRIPESIRTENDFLHEELVRILADGRPEALGI
jgi:hypothetical protein